MDSTKTAIKSLVLDLRKSLEADIEVGLRRYGITPTTLRPLDTLKHLNDRELSARIRMEETIRHEIGRDEATDDLADAVYWFVREVAFTHLNRLVGLKALEVRGLAPESIQTRSEYGDRSRALRDYRAEHAEAAALPDDGLELALQQVCRQIYPEFRLLFDVGDPAEMRDAPVNSLLWPSTPTLKACIANINELDEKIERSGPPAHEKATPEQSVWAEDEIIGWIYQFYNAEEKVSIRKKGKPKHPAEVAVINQFFTPRWIVKFLVDNTLGRLWLEMHPDSPRVRERCDYLVPEPLAGTEKSQTDGQIQLDPESPINHAYAEPRRAAKRPQEIRLIDPACGTMHFGHYAFEVFQSIYADAREQGWMGSSDALSDDQVPAAILENNLFGVDIDLRAVQLAALSLFMKAKSANPDAHVGQVNLIVADAHLPRGKVRQDFLAQYASEPVIQQAFQEVFESLDNVAEVGSLLRVEERFRQVLAAGGYQSKTPKKIKPGTQGQQAAFSEIAPGWSLEHTVDQMLGHLRQFARRALQEHDLNAQLFAAETEKSVALLDVFLHEYDVAVMNPPYGGSTLDAEAYLATAYEDPVDQIAMFVERGLDLVDGKGYVGALTSSTFLRYNSFKKFRENILFERGKLLSFIDLGWGVLDDAQNVTAAYVVSSRSTSDQSNRIIDFYRLVDEADKRKAFEAVYRSSVPQSLRYQVAEERFSLLPGSPLTYYAPDSFINLAADSEKVDTLAFVGAGAAVHKLFHRQWWEVDKSLIGKGKDWAKYTTGAGYAPYYYDHDKVVYWKNDGQEVKRYTLERYPYLGDNPGIRIQNTDKYFTEGLSYSVRTERFSVQVMDAGTICTDKGQGVFPYLDDNKWFLLGYLNSQITDYYLSITCDLHKNYTYIRQIPVARNASLEKTISDSAEKNWLLRFSWDTGNETCTRFTFPWLLQILYKKVDLPEIKFDIEYDAKLSSLIEAAHSVESNANDLLQSLQEKVDKATYELYGIQSKERIMIQSELGERSPQIVWPYAQRLNTKQKATEHVARLISYCLLSAIQDDPDGILPLTEASGHASVLSHVQTRLESHFGESAAYQVELDSADYLGRPLGEWLLKNFWKDFHIKWYKKRPILWQLQSQKGHFACLVQIHKMDRDTLPKVRSQYLWTSRNACQAALESARLREDSGDKSAAREVADLESMLDDLNDFERRLSDVIEARIPCEIPDWAQGPYRNGAYDPVLDDGVKVNILPLQEAGILAKAKVV
jgi:hypothetical protein